MTIPQYAWTIAAVNLVSLPAYALLHEDRKARDKLSEIFAYFWTAMKKRAYWQIMLYSMVRV